MRNLILCSALAVLVAGSASALSTFSDSPSFNGALGAGTSSVLETFGTNANSNTLNFSGITSTYVDNGNSFGKHRIINGVLDLFVDGDAPTIMTWALPSNVIGLGFEVAGANNSSYDGVEITIDDGTGSQTLNLFDVAGGTGSFTNGFVGFLGANTFSSVSFSGPGGFGSSGDQVSFDNLQIVTQGPVSPVPLPAAGWMLLAGLGGIAACRRRKRT